MSKIGRVALEAQEEVLNPLGYSTIEEAIADGWDSAEWLAARESEQEKAHGAWLKEKEELLKKLRGLKNMEEYSKELMGDEYLSLGEIQTIDRAIKFIEGVSHE